ncbi:hypothetical protein AC1031_016132 [Aphanomyces cochlioides]|nr:hypothetical protein AC1031_016132 [Aphanomyces cochlioides]
MKRNSPSLLELDECESFPRQCKQVRLSSAGDIILLPHEVILHVMQYLDEKTITLMASTCLAMKNALEHTWSALFQDYIDILPNLHAATWKEYLKRAFCARERKCFVCLRNNSPAIRPWKYVNLCEDHRKHSIKSVLISKTYAKEQFSLKDADLAPLQYIVRGGRNYFPRINSHLLGRMKLYLEMEAGYCAKLKYGGNKGLKRIQHKKILRWQRNNCLKLMKHRQIECMLQNIGCTMELSQETCSKYADFLNRPRTKLSPEVVLQCVLSHAQTYRPEVPNWISVKMRSVRRYLFNLGDPRSQTVNTGWISEYCESKDPCLTPPIAYSRWINKQHREEEVKYWIGSKCGLRYEKLYVVFQDIIDRFLDKGSVPIGYGQYIITSSDFARNLEARYSRLKHVVGEMFPCSLTTDDPDKALSVLAIGAFKTYVFDGVAVFLGSTYAGARTLVKKYIEAASKCSTLENKLVQKLKREGYATKIMPSKGFLLKAINSQSTCEMPMGSLVQSFYHEISRLGTLTRICEDQGCKVTPQDISCGSEFLKEGRTIFQGKLFSDPRDLVQAVCKYHVETQCRRDAIFTSLLSQGIAVDFDQEFYTCVFGLVEDYIQNGIAQIDHVTRMTGIYVANRNLILKALKFFGATLDDLGSSFKYSQGNLVVEEFILTGSACVEDEVSSNAKYVALYLLFIEKWPCHRFLDAVIKEIVQESKSSASSTANIPLISPEISLQIGLELYPRIDADSFTVTMKTARRLIDVYIIKYQRKSERVRILHNALIERKWPEISYRSMELKQLYLENGLPCFCGIEISTINQLADILVKMHVDSCQRSDMLDLHFLELGVPQWTCSINRSLASIKTQFVRYGVAHASAKETLKSIKAIGSYIVSSAEYKRQMCLWSLLLQNQVDLVATLDEVDYSVATVIREWISRGKVAYSPKLVAGSTIENVEQVVEFYLDHYRANHCIICGEKCNVPQMKCSFCELLVCQSCISSCARCGISLCSRCSTLDSTTNETPTVCIGNCAA